MPMAIIVRVVCRQKRETQAEERSEVFLFVSMFTNQCPLKRKEELLTVIFEIPEQQVKGMKPNKNRKGQN